MDQGLLDSAMSRAAWFRHMHMCIHDVQAKRCYATAAPALHEWDIHVWAGDQVVSVWDGDQVVPVWAGDQVVPVWDGDQVVSVWAGDQVVPA